MTARRASFLRSQPFAVCASVLSVTVIKARVRARLRPQKPQWLCLPSVGNSAPKGDNLFGKAASPLLLLRGELRGGCLCPCERSTIQKGSQGAKKNLVQVKENQL